jgi:hypothetical protein
VLAVHGSSVGIPEISRVRTDFRSVQAVSWRLRRLRVMTAFPEAVEVEQPRVALLTLMRLLVMSAPLIEGGDGSFVVLLGRLRRAIEPVLRLMRV